MKIFVPFVSTLFILFYPTEPLSNYTVKKKVPSLNALSTIGKQAKSFTYKKELDTSICFILDLSIHNGKKRFFVYDIQNDSIQYAGLVAHGDCSEGYLIDAKFSNTPGSQCSSIGKYRVGEKYNGIFGRSYRLYGLDSSNSNAYKRAVVLHSHECIAEKEVYPDGICNSQGCPTVAPSFLNTLSKIIDVKKKPILLWVLARR